MRQNTKITRVSSDFDEWAKSICKERFVKGKDKRLRGVPRLSKALTRVPKLREILTEAKFDDN